MSLLREPWPWFVAGPVIGLFVPVLLLVGNKVFGFSGNLRHLCAALFPGRVEYFRHNWKGEGLWNLAFLAGTVAGGFVAVFVLGVPDVALSDSTRAALSSLGVHDFSGLAPRELFAWSSLLTWRGLVLIVGGGFLVGFGTAYAGGCTSGHAIAGLADFQLPSLVAVLGFFAGGLVATHVLLPWSFEMALLGYFALGLAFGVTLTKSEVVSWFRIQEMFRFQAFHMYGVIASALAVAAGSLAVIRRLGLRTIDGAAIEVPPKSLGRGYRYWIGGTLFGLGWAFTGACPGPLFALVGGGVGVTLVAIVSALLGTFSYGLLRSKLPH